MLCINNVSLENVHPTIIVFRQLLNFEMVQYIALNQVHDHIFSQHVSKSPSSSALCTPKAVWTRFFPVSLEISRLLAQGEVGEVKMVQADFGLRNAHITRSVEKELGGGALLDIGIYCLQFVLMVFNGEKPECIQATGVCLDTGKPLA